MNVVTMNNHTVPTQLRAPEPGLIYSLYRGLRGLGRILAQARLGLACADRAERLSRLSDAELARRGVKRGEVIEHAFQPFLRA